MPGAALVDPVYAGAGHPGLSHCHLLLPTGGLPPQTGMVWYGMVWYGLVWYGLVWYSMVWYVMVWYGQNFYLDFPPKCKFFPPNLESLDVQIRNSFKNVIFKVNK